jgi:hypothetical protein
MPPGPSDFSPSSTASAVHRRRLFLAGAIGLVILAGFGWAHFGTRDELPVDPKEAEVQKSDEVVALNVPESPFLNTKEGVKYVGSDACTKCHQNETETFRATGMGRSMALVDPMSEPADEMFRHARSGCEYEIFRRDGRLWHRENRSTPMGFSSEYPVVYAVGSGAHAKTYVAEADGFLVESPATWYSSRQAWDLSPGYDRPDPIGFQRPIGENCLLCHAGRVEPKGNSHHKMTVHEAAIGCERCHGPGSLHVDSRSEGADSDAKADMTIVNPARLSRDLAEAVCQQCHLHTAATVVTSGHQLGNFRPGLPLEAFRIALRPQSASAPLKVTGQVEQMHLSRCYTESATLTCMTCHDPHGFPKLEEKVAYYKQVCATCHKDEACHVDSVRRDRESPDNNCVTCHMPSSPTEVPHTSFTHHRIAVHERLPKDVEVVASPLTLVPWKEGLNLPEREYKRAYGLGYLDLAKENPASPFVGQYKALAYQVLTGLRASGPRDPVILAALSRMEFERGDPSAEAIGRDALASPSINAADRCTALFVVAAERFRLNDFTGAIKMFRDLSELRRNADDWLLISECEKALGNASAQQEALRKASQIDPNRRIPK